MILTQNNIQAAMSGLKIKQMDDKTVRASSESLLRDLYILAGLEPPLYYEQLDDLANDLKSSFPYLTFDEVKLAGKAGIAGELGDIRRPSYASIMRWTDAYNKAAMVADARKIVAERPQERPRITDAEGLRMMARSMPECAWRRWEDIRTTGSFGKATIPHVSAQLYDWLGEEGVLHLTPEERADAMTQAKKEVTSTTVWNAANLEGEKERTRSRAKHLALQTWMRKQYAAGKGLTLPTQVKRIYQ